MSLAHFGRVFFRARGMACACALVAGLCTGAQAQDLTVADTGQFTGPDRMQRLIEGAQAEGSVSLYFSVPLVQMNAIIAGFKEKYGIEVTQWRSESVDITRRTVLEQRSGRFNVDVIATASPEMEALQREAVLEEVSLPVFADLIEGSVVPGRAWIGSHFVIFAIAYNTNLITPADAPKSFEDLLHPRFQGKIAIEAENANWLMEIVNINGEAETIELFENIIAANGLSVRRGHSLTVNLVAAGEVPLAINVYHDYAYEVKSTGAPIEIVYLPPVIAMPIGVAAVRNATHPHAAILFLDYMLNEGQLVLRDTFGTPANQRIAPLAEELEMKILDVAAYVDEVTRWRRLYNELFVRRLR